MEANLISELVLQHGVVAVAFGFMLAMSNKRQNKLMDAATKREDMLMEFTRELSFKQGEIANQIFMMREDVADIRRNGVNKGDG